MSQLHTFTIRELRSAIKRKDVSFRQIAEAFLSRIEDIDGKLNSFISVDVDSVLDDAAALDKKRGSGDLRLGLLTGIPLAIKDNIVTRGLRTTCASKILANYIPPYDATVVKKLRNNQALLVGKTNCDEFAMGSSTENSGFQPTRNPWNLDRVPGGSSGGSAAAVAAHLVPGALGSDTGGSIRQPAAFCGTVGLKPTYGLLSRYGLVAFGSSLDQIGPIANSVRDVATILQVVAGWDENDSTSSRQPVGNFVAEIGKDVFDLRIGVPREWFGSGLDPTVEEAVRAVLTRLEGLGCDLQEVALPHTEYAIAAYYIIAPAEASSNLARYDGVKYGHRSASHSDLQEMYQRTRSEGFGEEVKRRIMIGTYVLSSGYYDAYFLKASKVRTLIKEDYLEAFKKVDVLVGPTTPSLPFQLGEKTQNPLEMYLTDIYTVTANLAGIPGLSLPCAFSQEGLPVGVQLLGAHFSEGKLLRLAHALEKDLALEFPPLAV